MKRIFILLILANCYQFSLTQSLPIFLDGKTDDWNVTVPTYFDNSGDGNDIDFIYFSVTNDENFLFIRLNLTPEIKLVENNLLSLYIDGDNNSGSGNLINGIGAELKWDFGSRTGIFYKNGNTSISFPDIQYRSLPTVTDTTYEIAIGRNVLPNGVDPLFTTQSIKIFFRDNAANGDWMPNSSEMFEYSFDDTPTEQLIPINFEKENVDFIRVVNWNVLNDGFLDPTREQRFERILQAVSPDIISFNEMWNSTAAQVKNKLDIILPLQSGSWNTIKLDGGNITATKFPVLQNWLVYPDHRITASLIDLPPSNEKDILIINSHLKCCDGQTNDDKRQLEVDAIISFILDAKTLGGVIDLEQNTPVIILGDLNLVGLRQQLTTLVTGEIINTQIFGSGAPPDWDKTDLSDLISSQSDKRTAYTWREDQSTFPPGRLDFQIYTNSVLSVEKDFVIQTEVMSQARLNLYGLEQDDTRLASDHFPKITDYSFDIPTVLQEINLPINFVLEQNYPNPFNPVTTIKYSIAGEGYVSLKIYNAIGEEVAVLVGGVKKAGNYTVEFNAENVTSGIYFYRIQAGDFIATKKMVLMK